MSESHPNGIPEYPSEFLAAVAKIMPARLFAVGTTPTTAGAPTAPTSPPTWSSGKGGGKGKGNRKKKK